MATEKKTFTAPTETEARARLERWKNEHPSAVVTIEHKPIIGTKLEPVKWRNPEPPSKIVSITVEYEEKFLAEARWD